MKRVEKQKGFGPEFFVMAEFTMCAGWSAATDGGAEICCLSGISASACGRPHCIARTLVKY